MSAVPSTARTASDLLRDVHVRVIRIAEALEEGDTAFAAIALEDLVHDLWSAIENGDRR